MLGAMPDLRPSGPVDAYFAPVMLLLLAALVGGASVSVAGMPHQDAFLLWIPAAVSAGLGLAAQRSRTGSLLSAGLLALAGMLLSLLPLLLSTRLPAGTSPPWGPVVGGYEIGNLILALLVAWHAWRGPPCPQRRWVALGGMFFGIGLENGGILMGYFAEHGYHVYLPGLPAPVATMIGWPVVIYLADQQGRLWLRLFPALRDGGLPRALAYAALITVVAVAADAQIDPYATRIGLWTWRADLALGPHWFGVPLLNYLAWTAAILGFAAATIVWYSHWSGRLGFGLRTLASLGIGWATAGVLFLVAEPLVLPRIVG